MAMERRLREAAAFRYKRAIRHLTGKPQVIARLLLERWELDELEYALRLWHAKDDGLKDLDGSPLFLHEIPIKEIMSAAAFEGVVVAIRHTPYAAPLLAAALKYRENGSLAYVETALERDYYARLIQAVRFLGGQDSREGLRIIAAEIDLLNLAWLGRLHRYYADSSERFRDFLIPVLTPLAKQMARTDLSFEELNRLTAHRVGGSPQGGPREGLELDRLALIEHLVGVEAAVLARGLLARYPFSITSVFSFYLLTRIELKNLCTVLSGKAAGFTEDQIARQLYGVG